YCVSVLCFFFFQAEDGIRYRNVTGVQTCALPIFMEVVGYFMNLSAIYGCQGIARNSPHCVFDRFYPRGTAERIEQLWGRTHRTSNLRKPNNGFKANAGEVR